MGTLLDPHEVKVDLMVEDYVIRHGNLEDEGLRSHALARVAVRSDVVKKAAGTGSEVLRRCTSNHVS